MILERFREALERAVEAIEAAPAGDRARLFKGLGVDDLEGFKACMLFDFEESPNLPIDVGNEVTQFLEDLEIRREGSER